MLCFGDTVVCVEWIEDSDDAFPSKRSSQRCVLAYDCEAIGRRGGGDAGGAMFVGGRGEIGTI
ncbi:hypothetical protein ACHAW5_002755 [Stephanodiscus triporus]|uniref:Uncharacterized protein n=1 Tax=Stephanodiscus triporus TaxID=2934178 RepID=A0ABD3NJJ8_9STRA